MNVGIAFIRVVRGDEFVRIVVLNSFRVFCMTVCLLESESSKKKSRRGEGVIVVAYERSNGSDRVTPAI